MKNKFLLSISIAVSTVLLASCQMPFQSVKSKVNQPLAGTEVQSSQSERSSLVSNEAIELPQTEEVLEQSVVTETALATEETPTTMEAQISETVTEIVADAVTLQPESEVSEPMAKEVLQPSQIEETTIAAEEIPTTLEAPISETVTAAEPQLLPDDEAELVMLESPQELESVVPESAPAAVTQLAEGDVVYLDDFGAVGDGVTSDKAAYLKAVEKANAIGAQAIALTSGKTYYFDVSADAELPGISLVGNGAEIVLSGYASFDLNDVNHFILSDITIKSPYSENANSQATERSLFSSTSDEGMTVAITNFSFIGTAKNSGSEVNRFPRVLKLPKVVGGMVENVHFENVGMGLSFADQSSNFTVRNVEGLNMQTLVFVREGTTSFVCENLNIVNTMAQQATWIGKNSEGIDMNGMDTLLIESSSDAPTSGAVLRNIRGTNCVERVIYCQASDVTAYDLFAQDTGGFKFVGSEKSVGQASNVEIFGATMVITDNSPGGNNGISQHYWIDDVTWHNILVDNRRSDMESLEHVFNIEEEVGDVTIDGFTVKNMHSDSPLIIFSGAAEGNVNSLTMSNVVFENLSANWSNEILWGFYQADSIDYADGSVGSIKIDNVRGTTSQELVNNSDFGRIIGDLSHKTSTIEVSDVALSHTQLIPALEVNASADTSNIKKLEVSSEISNEFSSSDFEFSALKNVYLPSNFKGSVSGDDVNISDTSGNQLMIAMENATNGNKTMTNAVKNLSATVNSLPKGNEWSIPVNLAAGTFEITVETSQGSFTALSKEGELTETSNSNPGALSTKNVAAKFDVYMTNDSSGNKFLNVRQAYASPITFTIDISKAQ